MTFFVDSHVVTSDHPLMRILDWSVETLGGECYLIRLLISVLLPLVTTRTNLKLNFQVFQEGVPIIEIIRATAGNVIYTWQLRQC